MNWKIIVGVLIILGGVLEFMAMRKDYDTGVANFNPIYGQLGCLTLIGLGFYLIKRGREKKKLK